MKEVPEHASTLFVGWKDKSHNYREEAENLRGMLLTITNDWRSLEIRAYASLFRILGLPQARSTISIPTSLKEATKRAQRYQPLTKDDVREAKKRSISSDALTWNSSHEIRT